MSDPDVVRSPVTGDLVRAAKLGHEPVPTGHGRQPMPMVSHGVVADRIERCPRAAVERAGGHRLRRSST